MATRDPSRATAGLLSRREVLKAGLAAGVTLSTWPFSGPTTLWGEEAGLSKRGGADRYIALSPMTTGK